VKLLFLLLFTAGMALLVSQTTPVILSDREKWDAWCNAAIGWQRSTDYPGQHLEFLRGAAQVQDWHAGAPILCDDDKTFVDRSDGHVVKGVP
jgi:hypothetical protein